MRIRTTLCFTLAALAGCGDASNINEGTPDLSGARGDLAASADLASASDLSSAPDLGAPPSRRVIVFVWDGLRPDSITQADTPNLLALRQAGVDFTDNHSTYPTFTMMNGASLATGSFPGTTGFYGNTLWQPGPTGNNASGKAVDFNQPAFTEDWGILTDLDAYYGNQLLLVGTLFQAAQKAGLETAAVGKTGPAFLQDYKKGGYIVDERAIWPLDLAREVQQTGEVPTTTPFAYPQGQFALASTNGNPTGQPSRVTLLDKATGDPTDTSGAPPSAANSYMLQVYLDHVLPKNPDLTLIWFRSPDSPEHNYGPGSPNYHTALKQQDLLLGRLEQALKDRGLDAVTDLIVVSDHGHSSVSGSLALFPLRAVSTGAVGAADPNGWSASGDVRMADLMTQTNPSTGQPYFTNVFDGQGCLYVPEMSGHKADGSYVYPTLVDSDGKTCGGATGAKYTTRAFAVPPTLPAKAIVIATNGGSDYIYVPDHDRQTVLDVVKFLEAREEVGAIFVSARYNDGGGNPPPGTLSMAGVKLENAARAPDVILSYDFDADAQVAGMPGLEYESMSSGNNRGMHGSFSPRDVHNTLIAAGPDFKAAFQDPLPTGNVDVAPTIAKLFGLTLPGADGRSLDEALASSGATVSDYTATPSVVTPVAQATALSFRLPTDPTGATTDTAKTLGSYGIDLHVKTLEKGGTTWTYFDYAKAVRQ